MEKTKFWQKIRHQLIPNIGTIVIVALMLFGYSVYAAPSAQTTVSTFPYQGTLTDASGNPVTDDVDMIFRIFDVSTGGTSLWTEAHTVANAVPVENGLFQLMLGSLVPIPESIWANSALYLEVQTGADTPMTPRELIGSVPRAVQADIVADPSLVQSPSNNTKIMHGKVSITGNGTSYEGKHAIDISAAGFTAPPDIVCSLDAPSGFMWICHVEYISKTSFAIWVHHVDGANWTSTVNVHWVAVGE